MNALNLQSSAFKCHCHEMRHRHYTSGTTGEMSGDTYAWYPGHVKAKTDWCSSRAHYIDQCGASDDYNYRCDGRHAPERVCFDLSHTHWWGNYSGRAICESGDTETYRNNTSTVGGNSDETRPNNYTMRIWKRIS